MPLFKSAAVALAFSIASIGSLAPASASVFRTQSSANSAAWFTTPTQAFTAKGLADLGAVSPAMPMHVVVGLQLSNKASAVAFAKSLYTPGSPNYHNFMTPARFAAYFGPSPATANAVAQYLASQGFTNVTIAPSDMLVSGDGTAATADSAFETSIHLVRGSNGATTFANVLPAQMPVQFAGAITGVLGLNGTAAHTDIALRNPAVVNAAIASLPPSVRSKISTSAFACGGGIAVGPTCIAASLSMNQMDNAYGDVNSNTGGRTNIGVFTEGSLKGIVTDLRTNEAANGRPPVPVRIVQVAGHSTDTSGADEWDLDTQASTAVAYRTKSLTLYNTQSLSDPFTTAMFDKWVSDDDVETTSASFSECEVFAYQDGAMATDDNIFFRAFVQGQSIFASSGDTGGSCLSAANGVPAGVPGVGYPSSSPFVVSVGGTTLYVDSTLGNYYAEIGWYSGGGGPSAFELNCPFQTQTLACAATRGTPDIALAADPNLGAVLDVVVAGAYEGVGGTSLSAPLANGIYSRLQSRFDNKKGAALPNLYNSYAYWTSGNPAINPNQLGLPVSLNPIAVPTLPNPGSLDTTIGGFEDILVGDNAPYPCLPGWDFETGLGSLNIENFVNHFPKGV